jgi:RTA1 like protein
MPRVDFSGFLKGHALMGRRVRYLGIQYSRFRPEWYYTYFIACDVVSLTLQGTGGGMSSSSGGKSQIGINIAIAGLSFQVFTLSIFSLLAIDFALAYMRKRGDARLSRRFEIFASFLTLAVVLILARCVFRIDELSNGYTGAKAKLVHNQGMFIGLEGV